MKKSDDFIGFIRVLGDVVEEEHDFIFIPHAYKDLLMMLKENTGALESLNNYGRFDGIRFVFIDTDCMVVCSNETLGKAVRKTYVHSDHREEYED